MMIPAAKLPKLPCRANPIASPAAANTPTNAAVSTPTIPATLISSNTLNPIETNATKKEVISGANPDLDSMPVKTSDIFFINQMPNTNTAMANKNPGKASIAQVIPKSIYFFISIYLKNYKATKLIVNQKLCIKI